MPENVLQFTTRVDLSGAKTGVAELAGVFQDGMDAAQTAVESASAAISSALDGQASAAQASTDQINAAYQKMEAQGLETIAALNAATAEASAASAEAASDTSDAVAAQAAAVTASVDIQAAAYKQLAAATLEAAIARRQISDAQSAFLAGELPAVEAETLLAESLERSSIAAEQLTLAKANLAEVTEYLATINKAESEAEVINSGAKMDNASASEAAAAAEDTEATAIRSTMSARMAASAEIRILEGNTQGMTRAAGAFLTMIPGVGAALQAAFAVFGAVALLEVIVQITSAIEKMRDELAHAAELQRQAFEDEHDKAQVQIDDIELTNAKLQEQIDKIEHHSTSDDGIAVMLADASQQADRLAESLDTDRDRLKKMLAENDPSAWAIMWSAVTNTGQGRAVSTGQQQKEMLKDQTDLAAKIRGIDATYKFNIGENPKAIDAENKKRVDAIHNAYQEQIDAYNREDVRLRDEILGSDDARHNNSTKIANVEGRIQELQDAQRRLDDTNKQASLEGRKASLTHGGTSDPDKQRIKDIETEFADLNRQRQLIEGVELEPAAAEKFWSGYLTTFQQGTDEYRRVLDETIKYSQDAHKQLFDEILKSSPDQAVHMAHGPEEHARALEAAAAAAERDAREEESVTKAIAKTNEEMGKHAQNILHTGEAWDKYDAAVREGEDITAQSKASIDEVNDKWLLATDSISQLTADQHAAADTAKEYATELDDLNKQLAKLQAQSKIEQTPTGPVNTDPANAEAIQQVQNKIQQLLTKMQIETASSGQKIADDITRPFTKAFEDINTQWLRVQNDLIAGNKNIRQAFLQAGVALVQDAAATTEKWLAAKAEGYIKDEIAQLFGIQTKAAADSAANATSVAQATATQAALTAAATAGNAERLAGETTANVSGAMSYAALAAAAAAAAVAGIPIIGPALAPGAAAETYASTLAYASLAAFEKGGVVDGSPGMPVPIMAHAGERVLSVPQTRQFDRMVNQSGQPSNSQLHVHYSPQVNAYDMNGSRSMLRAHQDEIVSIVKEAYKAGKLR